MVKFDSSLHHAAASEILRLHHAAGRCYLEFSLSFPAAVRFESSLHDVAVRFDSPLHFAAVRSDSPENNGGGKSRATVPLKTCRAVFIDISRSPERFLFKNKLCRRIE